MGGWETVEGIRVQWQQSEVNVPFRRQWGTAGAVCVEERQDDLAARARRTARTKKDPGPRLPGSHTFPIWHFVSPDCKHPVVRAGPGPGPLSKTLSWD